METYGWAIPTTDDEEDIVRLSINMRKDAPDAVELIVFTSFSNLAVELTPKQARELAWDLWKAATIAAKEAK